MVNIFEKDGIFTLIGEDFDIKIDNNRKIYVKKKNVKNYENIGSEIPLGYTSEEKKKFIYNLYNMMRERKNEINEGE